MFYILKLLFILLLIVVPGFMICLIKDMWGTPEIYVVSFLGILTIIISVFGILQTLFEDKFLYFIYGEPSNRNPW